MGAHPAFLRLAVLCLSVRHLFRIECQLLSGLRDADAATQAETIARYLTLLRPVGAITR